MSDSFSASRKRPETPLLDQVSEPADLRRLAERDLGTLADELRAETVSAVSETGGHLGAGLGVVELTIALHYIFDTPKDLLIWDVGHQSYPHKILTGRRDRIRSLRKKGGLSGFTVRSESPYDPFGTAHSSTSISAGLGFAAAHTLKQEESRVVCVIGDGAMSAGMAYEAMNNASALASRLLVVLNDNDMSIAPPVGAMSAYLSRLLSSRPYLSVREASRSLGQRLPRPMRLAASRAEEYARGMLTGGTLFEELGFFYLGPVDGHNLAHLLPTLRNIRNSLDRPGRPILLHVVTRKGKGYPPAEAAADKLHGVAAGFDTPKDKSAPPAAPPLARPPAPPAWTRAFSDGLLLAAERDQSVVALTAAMPSGTGLDRFAERFPERCFDVGIAEQHGVTFCAGLAAAGLRPFAAIYSTFLQRAYDQVVHDVAIQRLAVRFVLDRAGVVGADGATHHGTFDLAYLCCLPGFVVMAPADGAELAAMLATQLELDDCPSALRFPRGALPEAAPASPLAAPLEVGRGRVLAEGQDVALLSFGALLPEAREAVALLAARGISCTLADARFAKPLDLDLLARLGRGHRLLVTLEDGAAGGFGARVLHAFASDEAEGGAVLCSPMPAVLSLTLPDRFLEHATRSEQLEEARLSAAAVAERIAARLNAL